jgi:hypothetical protein
MLPEVSQDEGISEEGEGSFGHRFPERVDQDIQNIHKMK